MLLQSTIFNATKSTAYSLDASGVVPCGIEIYLDELR